MQKTKPGYKKVKWLFRKDIEIPEEWEKTTVGEHTFILVGNAFPSKEYSENLKDMRLLRGDNVTEGRVRWGEKTRYWSNYSEFKKFQLLENDFVISMDGSKVGKNYAYVKKLDLPCLLVQRVACLRSKSTLIQKYFGHIFGNKNFINYVNSVRTNSGIPHISTKDIQNFSLLLPPLPEQQKIASILSNVDELISSYDKTIESTKKLKKGLMQTLLTKGIGHKKFKKVPWLFRKEIEIPEEWEIKKIESLIKNKNGLKTGPFGSSLKKETFVSKGFKVYGQENVIPDDFSIGDYYITKEHFEKMKPYEIKPDDILISLVGTHGKISLVPSIIEPGIMNPRLLRIRVDETKITPEFLQIILHSKLTVSQIKKFVHGLTMEIMNTGILKKIMFLIPEISEQQKITSMLSSIDDQISKLELKKKSAESLKKGLMQKLLTGQIRVRV